MILAHVIAHSRHIDRMLAPDPYLSNADLITLQLRFHRFILPEFNTHRAISKNASSSRAVPTDKLLQQVEDDPAMPVSWGRNQKGMQAGTEIDNPELAKQYWLEARDEAVKAVKKMKAIGCHKQNQNRILEPFTFVSVIATATGMAWDHFLSLRDHPDADPTMQALAREVKKAIKGSERKILEPGEWHLPYVDRSEHKDHLWSRLARWSAARCCRVSYLKFDGTMPNPEDDERLFDVLTGQEGPMHSSPLEHQAEAWFNLSSIEAKPGNLRIPGPGSFQLWNQFRKNFNREGFGTT